MAQTTTFRGHQRTVEASSPYTPRDFSFRWRAERSMPMNSAVREILPPKRLICASRYSFSNISRASRKGKAMIC